MEIPSLEEFDRAFFARYGTAGDDYGAAGEVSYTAAGEDPFLREAAPAPSPAAQPAKKVNRKRAGPLEVLCDVARHTLTALLAAAVVAFVAPQLFGVQLLCVETSSLWPDYTVNTLIWVAPTSFERIKAGDDVSYQLPGGPHVIHKVAGIDSNNGALIVKGNDIEIGERIAYSQIQGVVRFHVHRLGPVPERLGGMRGIYISVAVVLAILLLWGVSSLLSRKRARQLDA